jgi:chemotaxis protein methyltransferase CheR
MSVTSLTLTPEVFTILVGLIEERVGLHYSPLDLELVGHKLSARALDAGFDSLLDYYYFLRYDPKSEEEFDALIDSLVVNETYFFREYEQLVVLVDSVLAPRIEAGVRPRVWCAACSTGEEPLTLAMILAERGLLDSCRIVASDVSRRALERAKRGAFGERALRRLPPDAVASRWLTKEPGRILVSASLREAIDWRRINLLDRSAIDRVGACDAIICRNVLIYFRDETTREVLDSLRRTLVPGGTLLVGVSESLLRFGESLACEERGNVFLYRRRDNEP